MVSVDYESVRGDSFRLDIQITSGGAPVNLTGYKLFFSVRAFAFGINQQMLCQYNSVDDPTNATVVDALAGRVSVVMLPTDTNNLPDYVTTLKYDVQISNAATSSVYTVQAGTITLSQDITRAVS